VTAARAEVVPLADPTLSRSRAALDNLANDVLSLNRRIDDELNASASSAIDVNGDLAAQGDLHRRLVAVADDLGTLDRRQEIARLAHRLPSGTALLTDSQLNDLKALQARQTDLAKQAAVFDNRITLAAQRREDIAHDEKEARSQAALANAVVNQAQATGQAPEAVAAAVTSPVVVSSPGAKTDAQKKAMADAISSQAAATGQSPEQIAASVDTVIAPQAPAAPSAPPPGADNDQPTTPPPSAPPPSPQPLPSALAVQPVYVYPYYYPYPYRPYYGPSASFYWRNGGGYHHGGH
jgi:hypothetical protein